MADHHVRGTDGARVVVVLSQHYHREGQNLGRHCTCGARWTEDFDSDGCHVWRNGVPADPAILDWTGNNVAVECCQSKET
jgi:hypothetical protein